MLGGAQEAHGREIDVAEVEAAFAAMAREPHHNEGRSLALIIYAYLHVGIHPSKRCSQVCCGRLSCVNCGNWKPLESLYLAFEVRARSY